VRWFTYRSGIGRAALLCAVLLAAPLSVGAREPDPGASSGLIRADAAAWRGRYCTGPSCTNRRGSPASALGFGMAVVATGWVARRRGLIASGS
jgi:hypothetical protein